MNLTGKQKAYLKSEAHHMQPIFQIGKTGLSEELIFQLSEALDKRELIKIHLLQNTEVTAEEAAEKIKKETGSEVVQKIGKTIVLFKPSSKEKNRFFSNQLPR